MSDNSIELLGDDLAATRAQHFVGRERELALWRDFIRPRNGKPLWFVSGPGGIGKTMLLHAFKADAKVRGRHAVYLDAARIPANPPTVNSALSLALNKVGNTTSGSASVPILLIDSFECWEELEGWLWQTFLPAQVPDLKIVFAGRHKLKQEWRVDSGWRALTTHSSLSPLSAREVGTYLWRRQVPASRHQHLLDFSSGYPLALAIATDAACAGHAQPGAGGI